MFGKEIMQKILEGESLKTPPGLREVGEQMIAKMDRERLEDALFYAGSQWGKAPTIEELLSALDAAGFKIVPKEHSVTDPS